MTHAPERQWPRCDREIRVFVSSTFRDMHAEREVLTKRVFPQLRKLCEERGLAFTEVDLRWGVTDEQKAEGKVLPICLAEIERCRPFFIGLLGERYGWIPDEDDIPRDLIDQQPWLEEHREHSVTEIEIVHGVLRNPAMANRACFYFRDPSYLKSLSVQQQADFGEWPTAEEADKYGPDEAERRAADRQKKLTQLKQRIRDEQRQGRLALREDYPDPKTLGEWVLRDLTIAINQEFPFESTPNPLDREAALHEAFARSRTVRRFGDRQIGVYIGRQEYFDRLEEYVAGNGDPLVVRGDSGGGKSALLANWAAQYRHSHPDDLVLLHFVGASADSTNWQTMLRRILGELKRRFDIPHQIPEKPSELRAAFANWLHMADARAAHAKCRIVLFIDALNQLEDREGALDLVWLPPEIPQNVRLVLSTLPGRPLDNLSSRGWPTLQLKPLEVEERRRLITDYLAQYTKALSHPRAELIATATQTANPLFLRALLEELRLFGEHEGIHERIGYYLAAETIDDLYGRILQRWEKDYTPPDRPGLVRNAMSLIWAARRGLSEAELLDLLGPDGELLPRAEWSPLFLAAEQSLVTRSGLINFFHDYLRQAVRDRYCPTTEAQNSLRRQLCAYFAQHASSVTRLLEELPWQLSIAAEWKWLRGVVSDEALLPLMWEHRPSETLRYWAQIEEESGVRMPDGFRHVLDTPATFDFAFTSTVAALLQAAGYLNEALSLIDSVLSSLRGRMDAEKTASLLRRKANLLIMRNEPQLAEKALRESDPVIGKTASEAEKARQLYDSAHVLVAQQKYQDALLILEKVERIARDVDDDELLAHCFQGRAIALLSLGHFEAALELEGQCEAIQRTLSDDLGIATCLVRQANLLGLLHRYDRALELLEAGERRHHELGYAKGTLHALMVRSMLLRLQGNADHARDATGRAKDFANAHGYSIADDALKNMTVDPLPAARVDDLREFMRHDTPKRGEQ